MEKTVILALVFLSCANCEIDPLVLTEGNSWSYRHRIETGPTVPKVLFQGISSVRIDSIEGRNDSLLFWTTVMDSATENDSVYRYENSYAIVNGGVVELGSSGNRPYFMNAGVPYFLIGGDFKGELSYAKYEEKIRYLKAWHEGPIADYGTTISGEYLQAIGMIRSLVGVFGGLRRDLEILSLMEVNKKGFDSSKVEKLGPVGVKANPRRRAGGTFAPKGRQYDLIGRLKSIRRGGAAGYPIDCE